MSSSKNDVHKNLMASWIKLGAELDALNIQPLQKAIPPFLEFGWEFDPKRVIDVLISPDRQYYGLKSILFAGLQAWIIYPDNKEVIRNAMMLKALLKLREAGECCIHKPRLSLQWLGAS